jgi:hypothetical protein
MSWRAKPAHSECATYRLPGSCRCSLGDVLSVGGLLIIVQYPIDMLSLSGRARVGG